MSLSFYFTDVYIHALYTPPGFTGIDAAYEAPVDPDLVLKAGEWTVDQCVTEILKIVQKKVRPLNSRVRIQSDMQYAQSRTFIIHNTYIYVRTYIVRTPHSTCSTCV